jgi:hypothetical protein|tara:strand:+ start:64 stop:228 length:165 start_codon:yes stop_codon:yes gene_type:complete
MTTYKVISVHDWWSNQSLARKMETALNMHSKDGWVLDNFELGHYGYSAIITLKK